MVGRWSLKLNEEDGVVVVLRWLMVSPVQQRSDSSFVCFRMVELAKMKMYTSRGRRDHHYKSPVPKV